MLDLLLPFWLCNSPLPFVVQKYPNHTTQALTWLRSLEGGPTAMVQASHLQFGVDFVVNLSQKAEKR